MLNNPKNYNLKLNLYRYLLENGYKIDNDLIIKELKKENYNIQNAGKENTLIPFVNIFKYKIYNKNYMVNYRHLILRNGINE